MEEVRSILSLQESASQKELEDKLKSLKVDELQLLCKETGVKRSGRKAELIGRLLTNWQLEFDFTSVASEGNSDPCSGSASKSLSSGKSLVDVHKIQSWTKSLASLADFTFMHLYHYLVNSKEKTFDEEGMKAYKSLKAYKYFADGYIRNVWAGEPQEQDDAVVVRCHCFSSLKAKKVYVVHLVVKKSGDVLSAACTCVAGKGEACSHIAALMFYVEDFMRQGHSDLPTDTAATDHLQQWHVPLSVMFLHSLWKASRLGRLNMARFCAHLLVIATAHTPLTTNQIMTMHRRSS